MKRYRMRFVLEDDVAAWFEGRPDKGETVAEALTICCRLDKLRQVLDGLVRQSSIVSPMPLSNRNPDARDKTVRLMENILRGLSGDDEEH